MTDQQPATGSQAQEREEISPAGYYWSIYKTGDAKVDNLLSAICRAARASHSTEHWDEPIIEGVPTVLADIQTAADEAAGWTRRPSGAGELSASDIKLIGELLDAEVPSLCCGSGNVEYAERRRVKDRVDRIKAVLSLRGDAETDADTAEQTHADT